MTLTRIYILIAALIMLEVYFSYRVQLAKKRLRVLLQRAKTLPRPFQEDAK